MARPPAMQIDTAVRVVLNVRSLNLTDDQFIRLCSDNRDLRIEMSAERELIIMPPPGSKTGQRNANVIYSLMRWAKRDGTGICFHRHGIHSSEQRKTRAGCCLGAP